MAPRLSAPDVADRGSSDAIESGYFSLQLAGCTAGADVGDIGIGEMRVSIPRSAGEPLFRDAIQKVLTASAVKKMIGANARRIVAAVAAVITWRQWAVHRFVGIAVRDGWFCSVDKKQAVAEIVPLASPQPTRSEVLLVSRDRTVLIDLAPKPSAQWYRPLGVLVGHRVNCNNRQ